MKRANKTRNNLLKILTALFISLLMCFCMSACGDDTNTEETIEITTPSEQADAPAEKDVPSGDTEQDEDDSDGFDYSSEDADDSDDADDADDEDEDADDEASKSQYAKIYKDCKAEMKKAKAKYVDELEGKVSEVSKSTLYDETQARIEDLKKIYDGGKDKMVKAMLASTEDDADSYEKYYTKMTETYSEYTRDLTNVYTDAF